MLRCALLLAFCSALFFHRCRMSSRKFQPGTAGVKKPTQAAGTTHTHSLRWSKRLDKWWNVRNMLGWTSDPVAVGVSFVFFWFLVQVLSSCFKYNKCEGKCCQHVCHCVTLLLLSILNACCAGFFFGQKGDQVCNFHCCNGSECMVLQFNCFGAACLLFKCRLILTSDYEQVCMPTKAVTHHKPCGSPHNFCAFLFASLKSSLPK